MMHKGSTLKKCIVGILIIGIYILFISHKWGRDHVQHVADCSKCDQCKSTVLHQFKNNSKYMPTAKNNVGVQKSLSHQKQISVAIVTALTTRGRKVQKGTIEKDVIIFGHLFASFCKTASPGYDYHFYIGYDYIDEFLRKEHVYFKIAFTRFMAIQCQKFKTSMHMVQCNYSRQAGRSQNDAAMQAYLDGIDYIYRVNDDTVMQTPGWTEGFITTLAQFNPTNVGVVAPAHKGDWQLVLQYDFTHRTHVDIFGCYYPWYFKDWKITDWMTYVYAGVDRVCRLEAYTLLHTEILGTRYKPNDINITTKQLTEIVESTKTVLYSYMDRFYQGTAEFPEKRVVSYSIDSRNNDQLFGVLRNSKLAKVYFSGWTVRLYIDKENSIPVRYRKLFLESGVEIVEVDQEKYSKVPVKNWKYLVALDKTVDVYLIRRAESRLNLKESASVGQWLVSGKPFHFIHDGKINQGQSAIQDGIAGARRQQLEDSLKSKGASIEGVISRAKSDTDLLKELSAIYKLLGDNVYCHDCVNVKAAIPPCHVCPAIPYQDKQYYNNTNQYYDIHEMMK